MRIETTLAKASLTRVERRDPYKLKHKMKLADLKQLAPNFDWDDLLSRQCRYPPFEILNVDAPAVLQGGELAADQRIRWTTGRAICAFMWPNSVVAVSFVGNFVKENFEFYRKYLRGAKEMQPRWKRCVQYVD